MTARRWTLGLIFAAVGVGGLGWYLASGGRTPIGPAIPPTLQSSSVHPTDATPPARPSPPDEEPSHVADDLNSPRTDIHSDLRIVNDLLAQYRSATHGLNPVGENAEITAVLTGRNRLGFAFLPLDHPAIDAQGELCDRWGTPFFFHALSGTQMEIRSAGPDRKLWTDDDVVLTPGLHPPHL